MPSANREETKMLAHVKPAQDGKWDFHSLEEHLVEVGRIARDFASDIGGDWAYLSGLWHDIGKYRPDFQNYIRNVSGFDPEAHIEQGKGRVDHSTAGAVHAIERSPTHGRILAYLIAGHHAGLPDWSPADTGRAALEARLGDGKKKKYLDEAKSNSIPESILNAPLPAPESKPLGEREGLHLWIRMLFSCLVDADFLDTEAFMSPEKTKLRKSWPDIVDLKRCLDTYLAEKMRTIEKTRVNTVRARVLDDCRLGAQLLPGTFTLTVPTGGGKTLSSMAFALEHALRFKKRRVIVAIPYTSIIEQTADQYRAVFGEDSVLEHHSNLESDEETSKSRLATENWDAPIIVTTNVQLLESLFAAKTSRCRKLHNLIDSIIIIDEAQLLPPNFLQPVLDVINLLTRHYGVTVVLSTATQPALATVKNAFGQTKLRGLDSPREIIRNSTQLYRELERVKIEKPLNLNAATEWADLAGELRKHDSVLAIVNTRKDCRTLFDLMPEGAVHLSASMCGKHRSQVITDIKRRLKNNESVRVISTQIVEAGVDLDFPIVYRALTGLDSIAQAAGRCNREGRLECGRVVVFVPPRPSPKGTLLFAEQATKSVWHGNDAAGSDLYEQYFRQYFSSVDVDEHKIHSLLTKDADECAIQFRTAAEKFRLIDDKGVRQILVPYGDGQKWIDILRNTGPERYVLRKLQRYCVSVYDHAFRKLQELGAIQEVQLGLGMWAVCVTNAYDNMRGLLLADELFSGAPEDMVL